MELVFVMACLGLAVLIVAGIVEAYLARGMRRRRRAREAYHRYVDLCDREARVTAERIAAACFYRQGQP